MRSPSVRWSVFSKNKVIDTVEDAVSHRFLEAVAPRIKQQRAICFRIRQRGSVRLVVAFSSSGLKFLDVEAGVGGVMCLSYDD